MAKQNDDFKDRYFNSIDDRFDRLENKLDANTKLTEQTHDQAVKTNGRVNALEKEVFGKVKPSDLPPWYRDPKIISVVFNITLILLLLVAAATRFDIGKLSGLIK